MKYPFKHGMSFTRFYRNWVAMKRRCYEIKFFKFPSYGGRGIKVSDRWLEFENFKEDMYKNYLEHCNQFGEKNTLIDRIDNNGNYEFKNCRWATNKEQCNNKRNSKFITYDGITLTAKQWADKIGISKAGMYGRIKKWGSEKAVSTPLS